MSYVIRHNMSFISRTAAYSAYPSVTILIHPIQQPDISFAHVIITQVTLQQKTKRKER